MPRQIRDFQPDISSIQFPTDQITLGQMRKQQPELLQNDRAMLDRHPADVEIINAARIEHILARKAWASALGLPDPDEFRDRKEELQYLTEVYKEYGIASGPKHTEELVKAFETEAARLAGLSAGRSPG